MIITAALLLRLLALILFLMATIGVTMRVNVTALGLAAWVLSTLV